MFDVVVIGGGLAGSSLAQRLASRFSVALLESERYPVHKMCGEFLSPESIGHFRALGVDGAIEQAGAVPIRRVTITSGRGAAWSSALPGRAIGFSRWMLDPILFESACAEGAEGRQGATVTAIEGDAANGFVVRYDDGEEREVQSRLVVGAYGKRARLDKSLGRGLGHSTDLVAFKMHYTGDDLGDAVELHAFRGGYCGMSHVENGLVNACLIASKRSLIDSGGSYGSLVEAMARENGALARRMERLTPVMERPVAIAQVSLRKRELFAGDVLMVGDTAAMIAPLCGDGMAMALSSAELAADAIAAHLEGRVSFSGMQLRYESTWRRRFASRLRIGRVLQSALFRPAMASAGLELLARVPLLGSALIRATRERPAPPRETSSRMEKTRAEAQRAADRCD